MKVLFIDTEKDIEDALKIKDSFDELILLNPTEKWLDTESVKTVPSCYSLEENKYKFGQIRFEVKAFDEFKVLTRRPESFIVYNDMTFGNMIGVE